MCNELYHHSIFLLLVTFYRKHWEDSCEENYLSELDKKTKTKRKSKYIYLFPYYFVRHVMITLKTDKYISCQNFIVGSMRTLSFADSINYFYESGGN